MPAGPVAGFDWDNGNQAKCRKHGVSIAEVEDLFTREVLMVRDDAHSQRERRVLAIGKTMSGRSVLVAFTVREKEGREAADPPDQRPVHAQGGGAPL
ncbi:MAG: BrnT family toxin [Gammaproteobacteria bacterium]